MKNNYFPALTGLRAIAAFMVYVVHKNPFKKEAFGDFVFNFFNEFHVGVSIFFVLSGFLIALRYFDSNIAFKNYFINRFARIYPVYFVLTTLLFLYTSIFQHQNTLYNFKVYLLNISFLRGFFENFAFSGIGQGWTLTVEETFYIMAPIIFILLKKSWENAITIPLGLLISGLILITIFQNNSFYGFMNSIKFMLEITFFGRAFEFFVGIALAIYFLKMKSNGKTYFTYMGIFFMIICIYFISTFKGTNYNGMESICGILINNYVLSTLAIAPLIYGLVKEKTVVSTILESKLFILLGKSSYVFYLIHIGFISSFLEKHIHNYVLIFVLLNLIAILIYQFFEKPTNQFIKEKFRSIKPLNF